MAPPPVLLVTKTFPYGHGETFLETELGFLAGNLGPITCLPERVFGPPRPLPDGVGLDHSLARSETGFFRRTGHTLAACFTGTTVIGEIIGSARHALTPKGLLRLLAAARRAAASRAVLSRLIAKTAATGAAPILYTYWFSGHTIGAANAGRRAGGIPVVTRAHRVEIYENELRPPWIPFRRRWPRGLAAILTVSEHGRRHLAARFPGEEDRIRISRLGVGDPGPPSSASADDGFRILSCSYCVPVKRVDLLARGIAAWGRRQERPATWTHLGGGPQLDSIRTIAREILPSHVEFRSPGQLANREILEHYRKEPVDLFATTSASEGVPVSIMEALSFGVPVLATAVGGVPEIVNTDVGCLLDEDPGPEQVATALSRLADEGPGDRAARRAAAREQWRTRYHAEANYAEFVRLLETLGETG